jgi:uncharacterized protein
MFLISGDFWETKKTNLKGLGVFARKEIKSGTVISDYLGQIINTADYDLETDKLGLYLMYYSDEISIYPDLQKPGPHLVNHSCRPNCWIYIFKGHTLFFALKNILPGEELTISYLLSPRDKACNPCMHVCKCGSQFCTGSMHLSPTKYELWQAFQKTHNKTRRAKAIIGQNLPRLNIYPTFIDASGYTELRSSG